MCQVGWNDIVGMVVLLGCAGAVIVYGSYVYLVNSGCKMGICVVDDSEVWIEVT